MTIPYGLETLTPPKGNSLLFRVSNGANIIDLTFEDMEDVIFGHPTVSEVILSACHAVK